MNTTGSYLTAAIVVVVLILVGTITGRYILRRIAWTLGVVAVGAVLVLDGNSPL